MQPASFPDSVCKARGRRPSLTSHRWLTNWISHLCALEQGTGAHRGLHRSIPGDACLLGCFLPPGPGAWHPAHLPTGCPSTPSNLTVAIPTPTIYPGGAGEQKGELSVPFHCRCGTCSQGSPSHFPCCLPDPFSSAQRISMGAVHTSSN